MPNKMLIDASHPEETRVVVVRGNRIEEFDFESQDRKQLKGNIYLARVTRVEPSLQAAFVEYGGNRHGFLAFSEIHPDYYQIPIADRQALLLDEAAAAQAEEAEEDEEAEGNSRSSGKGRYRRGRRGKRAAEASSVKGPKISEATGNAATVGLVPPAEPVNMDNLLGAAAEEAQEPDETVSDTVDEIAAIGDENGAEEDIESVGAEDALEEVPSRRKVQRRNYKIQEVIKRRQILLVQVVKEERGNKGAALTTYLSLAGRYSVLMPNTARGGGISRKITNLQDRKRLKEVVRELEVPQGMGVILRTAGANRTRAEIKRDYEYLMRLWENVRELTLKSTAPCLVYEEGSLIKRSVRDLYNKDIDEILVSGDDGYREAKDFMRMLMPSHAKSVQPYRQDTPIFARNNIEAQLDRMLQPHVTLKSGGYIIINQTEALVSIDVNSGRSTREHSIEDTAVQTNLEAAEEVARQLRLRDLAGLIVIDFIDMEEKRNNRAVEKRLKDCLKNDRARIQVGRISHFGLLEMSRQRIRASVLESTMSPCPHCAGTGYIRSASSVALMVLRSIEEHLIADSRNNITVRTPTKTALYILNNKREMLSEFEMRFGLSILIEADEEVGAQHYAIEKGSPAPQRRDDDAKQETSITIPDDETEDDFVPATAIAEAQEDDEQEGRGKRRRKRRRRRGNRDRDESQAAPSVEAEHSKGDIDSEAQDSVAQDSQAAQEDDNDDGDKKRRRRGKRGGRRNKKEPSPIEAANSNDGSADDAQESAASENNPATAPAKTPRVTEEISTSADEEAQGEPAQARKKRSRSSKSPVQPEEGGESESESAGSPADANSGEFSDTKSARGRNGRSSGEKAEPVVTTVSESAENERETKPRRTGWWQRKSFF
jgi:ribonuclease E